MCSFVCDFIALEIMESVLTFHDDNFCQFHVLHACTGDACALETRRRFVTERGKKKRKKTKPKFKPRPHCLGKNTCGQHAAATNDLVQLSLLIDWFRLLVRLRQD